MRLRRLPRHTTFGLEPSGGVLRAALSSIADAIGQRMEVTVIRNGALIDAVAVPSELPN